MRIENPYAAAGEWYRGNLHTHCTNSSCGQHSLEEVIGFYTHKRIRSDFVAMTDHRLVTDLSAYRDYEPLVMFQGTEIKADEKQMLLIGLDRYIENDPYAFDDLQDIIDRVNKLGGMSIICHPHLHHQDYWPLDELLVLRGYHGIEIYNENVSKNNSGRAVATDWWDALLSKGVKVWGFANDDMHTFNRVGCGFNVVRAGGRAREQLLKAMKAGSFYASTGVMLSGIEVQACNVSVTAKLDVMFRFIGRGGRIFSEVRGTEAAYSCRGHEGYIRVEALREDGKMAWTQPFYVYE